MNSTLLAVYKDLVLVMYALEIDKRGLADQCLFDAMCGLWNDMSNSERETANKYAEEVLGD